MRRITCLISASLLLAACSGEAPAPATPAPAPATAAEAPAAGPAGEAAEAVDSADPVALLARANAALGADRVFAPAGDNAVELYLQVITATEGGAGEAGEARRGPRLADVVNDGDLASQARLALNDVFPYGTVWVEQALQRGDRAEAERVLTLLERVQPGAPALQRLRQALVVAAAPPPPPRATPTPAPPPAAPRPAPSVAAAPVASAPPPVTEAPPEPAAASVPAPAAPVAARSETVDSPAAETVANLPAPELINRVTPRYPPRAMRQKLEGWVAVRLLVDGDGEVIDSAVVAADPEGIFEREALAAAQRWRFSATGRESWVERRIDFRLTR